MLKRSVAMVTAVALLVALAGCLPGDPDPSPVGLISVQGQPAAVIPSCDDEQVLGITIEADAYDQNGNLKPESEILWKVTDPKQPDSTGPFVIGDRQPWATENKPVTGSLPDRYLVSIETTRRNAGSFLERSKITTLKDGQVLIDGNPGSLDSLAERWGC
jgi:hypothetical protein